MSEEGGEVFCSRHWNENTFLLTFYKVIIILFIFLTITATLGNSLILVVLHKDSSLHKPSKLLLRSLTITDLCVGAISQPLFIAYILATVKENFSLCRVIEPCIFVVNTIFPGVSLFTLTAIGMDTVLALLLRLRYRQVVTVKRVRVAVFLFWLTGGVVGFIYVWSSHLFFTVSGVLVFLFVVISTFSYTKIFRTIQRQQTQVQDALGIQNTGLNMARYKKTVFNALWIHFALTACYLPYTVITVVITVVGFSKSLYWAEILTVSLVYLNSSVNPFLYCWKMREVRLAVRETVRQVYVSCSC